MASLLGQIEQNDCLYGKLNQQAKEVEYKGGTTNTTRVNINDKIITVDANIDVDKVEAELSKANTNYDDFKTKSTGIISDVNTLKIKVDNIGTQIDEKLVPLSNKVDKLEDEVDTKAEESEVAEVNSKIKQLTNLINNKADALSKNGTDYWYLMSGGAEGTPIAGPYDLGSGGGGGGGGGSATEVHISAIDWPTIIAYGTKCVLRILWSSTKSGSPTGNGTILVYVNGENVITEKNIAQGIVDIDVTDYIPSGTCEIEVRAQDAYSTTDKVIQQLTTVSISLESNFDSDRVFKNSINYTYIPTATVSKTVYFYVDDTLYGTKEVTVSGEQQTYQITDLTHGSHKLRVYFTCVIGTETVTSNELNYDLMFEVEGNTSPMITSTFNSLNQEQYIAFTIPYRVYTPNYNESSIDLIVNGTVIQTLSVNQDTQYWEYKPDSYGSYILTIKTQNVEKTFNINIEKSSIDVHAVTENLSLYLTSTGRSNAESETDRQKWEDTEHGISCTLSDFNFNSNGWIKDTDGNTVLRVSGDARVSIPYKIFENDCRSTGKTVEFEIATNTIKNYESTIISCISNDIGLYVTPQIAKIKSEQSSLQTQYKEDDHVRLTFVVEKNVESHLMLMYINGVMCGAVQYPLDDNFKQLTPVSISIGSNDATTDIYNIRIYDNNLNRKQVVNNWIADTQSGELKATRYNHNDNFNDTGDIVINKLPLDLPYIIWDIETLPQYKGNKLTGNVTFINQKNTSKSFTSSNATYNVQGTSSAVYPVKNLKVKYKTFINGATTSTEYVITDNGIGAKEFTYKADYASSEGANNVELVRLYNDSSKLYGIFTPPQKIDSKVRVGIDGFPIVAFHKNSSGTNFYTKMNFNNDKGNEAVYGLISGDESWEITNNNTKQVLFQSDDLSEWGNSFEARYPDVGDEADITKLQDMLSWVVSTYRQKATNTVFESPKSFTYTEKYLGEDNTWHDRTVTKTFSEDSREYRLTKFKAELSNYFNIDSTLFYYLFTELFLMVDSRAKNAFPTYFKSRTDGDNGNKWYWLPYDMDTAIGINNEGALVFDYNLEDIDPDSISYTCDDSALTVDAKLLFNKLDKNNILVNDTTAGYDIYKFTFNGVNWIVNNITDINIDLTEWGIVGTPTNTEFTITLTYSLIFNGQESVMWCNVRDAFEGELTSMYQEIRSKGYWSYNNVESAFEDHQSKWSENIFNTDSYLKYIVPLVEQGTNYLEMLQGSKAEQRKWWLYNRFRYMDSKYTAGDAVSDNIILRAYGMGDVEITPYADIYAAVKYGNTNPVEARCYRNNSVVLKNPLDQMNDTECTIYSASQLKFIGDLSPLKVGLLDVSKAIKLQELKVGSSAIGYENPNLKSLTLGNNVLLDKLDASNCTGLTQSVDISGCTNITEVYFDNTNITGVSLPATGTIKKLHLPDTLTALILRNHTKLDDLQIAGTENLKRLWLENIPSDQIDAFSLISEMPSGAAIRLIGFEQHVNKTEDIEAIYDLLDTMTGINAQGEGVDKAQVNGKIYINNITYADYTALSARYLDVKIIADIIICKVDFYNGYGDDYSTYTLYNSQNVASGSSAEKPIDPTYPSTEQYYYEFKGWSDDFMTVTSDMSIYSIYDRKIQVYDVIFNLQSDIPKKIDTQHIEYGNKVIKPEDPIILGTEFLGWYTEPNGGILYDFNTVVTHGFTLYAHWNDYTKPSANITGHEFNKIKFKLTDNIAITSYQITMTDEVPTTWINLDTPVSEYDGEYVVESSGTYYVWAKDAADKVNIDDDGKCTCNINCYSISIDAATGTSISLYENTSKIGTFAIEGTEIEYHVDLDEHYENLESYRDGIKIDNLDKSIISADRNYLTICSPRLYTIKFDIGEYGEPVPDQTIVYLHKVVEPTPQYIVGKVVDSWYTEPELINKWNFDTELVVKDVQLYAKWVVYHEPTTINITLKDDSEKSVTVNYNQSIPNGIQVDWGDSTASSTSDISGNVNLAHEYAETGDYTIKVWCNEGTILLGCGLSRTTAVAPASVITGITFAWNMATTSNYCLANAINLTELEIPRTMSTIAYGMCYGCTNLTTLTLPSTLTKIDGFAFSNCSSLSGLFTIPASVKSIGDSVFASCTGITGFEFGENIESFGKQTFRNCTGLHSFIIPDTITELPNGLFNDCTNLTSMIVHSNITHMGQHVFTGCSNIESIKLMNPDLTVDGEDYNYCPLIKTAGPLGGGYNIEFAWATEIPVYAFKAAYNTSSIISVVLPETIVSIGAEAFTYCTEMTSINLPAGLTYIGSWAFIRCMSLTKVEIPATVTFIGDKAYQWCTGLTKLIMKCTSSTNKINATEVGWFMYCSNGALNIDVTLATPEDALVAFGQYWNYKTETETITVNYGQ